MVSPFFRKGSDLAFERPGVARLLVDLPIGVGDRGRAHQPAGVEIDERRLAFALFDAAAHPFGVDAGVDHEMGDVDVLWPELARRALRHRAQPELGAGESRIANPAAPAGGRAGEEDIPTAA